MSVRLSVNINDETAAALREMAEKRGDTVTEIVRRAVSVYDFFATAQDQGKRIQSVSDCGCKVTEVTIQ